MSISLIILLWGCGWVLSLSFLTLMPPEHRHDKLSLWLIFIAAMCGPLFFSFAFSGFCAVWVINAPNPIIWRRDDR